MGASKPALREGRVCIHWGSMYYVYLLKLEGIADKSYYIGYSHDLRQRFRQHQNNQVHTTMNKNPKLIYYESYLTEQLARERETKLKAFGSAYVGLLKRLGLR